MIGRLALVFMALGWAGCDVSTTAQTDPDASRPGDAHLPDDAGDTRDSGDPVDGHDASGLGDAGRPSSCALPPESGPCEAYMPRYHFDAELGMCRRFIYGGCGANANNFQTLSECAETCGAVQPDPCWVEATHPSLPGVTLRIEGDRCYMKTGESATFDYTIEVDEAIEFKTPDTGGGCGKCVSEDDWSDPTEVADVTIGDGGDIRYCLCDVGCCPATEGDPKTLSAGTYEAEIDWSGRQWNGPSDWDAPMGDAFPAGTYAVEVRLSLPDAGELRVRLPIHVVQDEVPATKQAAETETACQVDGTVYPSGTAGLPHPQGCDRCACDAGDLRCADSNCFIICPDGTTASTSCARCGPADCCEVRRHDCFPSCETADDCAGSDASFCHDGVCRNLCG